MGMAKRTIVLWMTAFAIWSLPLVAQGDAKVVTSVALSGKGDRRQEFVKVVVLSDAPQMLQVQRYGLAGVDVGVIDVGFQIERLARAWEYSVLVAGVDDKRLGVVSIVDVVSGVRTRVWTGATDSRISAIAANAETRSVYLLEVPGRTVVSVSLASPAGGVAAGSAIVAALPEGIDPGFADLSCNVGIANGCFVEDTRARFGKAWLVSEERGELRFKVMSYWERFAPRATSWWIGDEWPSIESIEVSGTRKAVLELRDAFDGTIVGSAKYVEPNAVMVLDGAGMNLTAGLRYFVSGDGMEDSRPFCPLRRAKIIQRPSYEILSRCRPVGPPAFAGAEAYLVSCDLESQVLAVAGTWYCVVKCIKAGSSASVKEGTVVLDGDRACQVFAAPTKAVLLASVSVPDDDDCVGGSIWVQFVGWVGGGEGARRWFVSQAIGVDIVKGSKRLREADVPTARETLGLTERYRQQAVMVKRAVEAGALGLAWK